LRAIFISYRRNDTEGEAGRLFDDLISEFGENSVFMDVAAIEAGRDFRKVIDESVSTCGVLLAIIGKGWVDAKDDAGHRRLEDPTDFVRLETASALRRDIPVIPILVRGATMPRPEQLPDDLHDLAYRNSVELTHARWNSDLQLLVDALRRQLKIPKAGAVAAANDTGETSTVVAKAVEEQAKTAAVPVVTQQKKPTGLMIGVGVCVIAALAGVYYFLNRQVTVPSLRGDTIAIATAKLNAAHLKAGQTTVRQDASVDPNVVLSQYPPSDEQVRSGTAVDLVVSAAAPQVEVPSLTGQSLDDALHVLAGHQLSVGDVERQARAGVARDTILQQFPNAGEMVKVNGKIDLLVADTPPAETTTPATSKAGTTADADWEAKRATQRAAAKQAALAAAAKKAEADKGAGNNSTETKIAVNAATNVGAATVTPKVTIRSASCTTLAPGKYKLDIAGDALVGSSDTYLFYTWASIGNAGTRWRPQCQGWGIPTSSDDQLWEVSCIHRPGDAAQMSWQTSRTITSANNQPPTTGGTTLFKPGMQAPSNLKFNITCQ
jgi:hypothetical protein